MMRLLVSALLAMAACGPEFDPPSLLDDLRVLALLADPLEAGATDEVTVTAVTHVPSGEQLAAESWSFCPFSVGATAAFSCAVPQCEVSLTSALDGAVTATPGRLVRDCLDAVTAGGAAVGPIPDKLPESVEVLFRYRAELTSGLTREAVVRLPLYTGAAPSTVNRSPAIARVTLAGQALQPGQAAAPVGADQEVELVVRIDNESLDTFVDPSGRSRTEEPVYFFYATGGRFDEDRDFGAEGAALWRAEQLAPGVDRVQLYVVARDLRGGQAVAGPFEVPISR